MYFMINDWITVLINLSFWSGSEALTWKRLKPWGNLQPSSLQSSDGPAGLFLKGLQSANFILHRRKCSYSVVVHEYYFTCSWFISIIVQLVLCVRFCRTSMNTLAPVLLARVALEASKVSHWWMHKGSQLKAFCHQRWEFTVFQKKIRNISEFVRSTCQEHEPLLCMTLLPLSFLSF